MYQRPVPAAAPAVALKPIELIPSRFIRQGDHPELPQPIPGLLEGYLTILAGAGGVGKTYLAEQISRHLASKVQLGRFPLPDVPVHTWFLVLEDVAALTQQRSLEVAGLGTLAEDASPEDIGCDTLMYITDGCRGIASLRERLEAARDAGETLPGAIVIDYLHKFIGSQPSGVNPVTWETQQIEKLRQIGIDYDAHVLVLTHMTKEGKVNGTNALLNACDSMYVLGLNGEDRDYAALVCRKMRMAPMVDYALSRKGNGSWGFDDQVLVSEAQAEGIMRAILGVLRKLGPQTLGQLLANGDVWGERAGIRTALSRGRARGFVHHYQGHWHLTIGPGDQSLRPEPPRLCAACRQPMVLKGSDYHPCCDPTVEEPPPPPPPVEAYETPADAWGEPALPTREATVLDSLKDSIARSKYRPLPVIKKEYRDAEPWTLITETMGSEPNWMAPGWDARMEGYIDDTGARKRRRVLSMPAGMGGTILTLDRNGSYPSACGSVPVAPNKLHHTGAMTGLDRKRAGIFLLPCPDWTPNEPHPLGAIAAGPEPGTRLAPGTPVWVSTPHARLLAKLFPNEPLPILDSWTGVANDSLFERFADDAKAARRDRETNPEAYTEWKLNMGKALRILWPKEVRSPFWRPDWRVSVVAEAAVRHWIRAHQAATTPGPHILVGLLGCDEVIFWTPDGAVPPPYTVGNGYGEVDIKHRQEGTQ